MTRSATVELSNGVPLVSDAELKTKLAQTDLSSSAQQAIVDENANARPAALRASLWPLALFLVIGLFFTPLAPNRLVAEAGAKPDPPATG